MFASTNEKKENKKKIEKKKNHGRRMFSILYDQNLMTYRMKVEEDTN